MSDTTRTRRTGGSVRVKNGVWQLRRRIAGKDHWERLTITSRGKTWPAGTRDEAKQAAAIIEYQLEHGAHTPADARRLTFTDLETLVRTQARVDGLRSLPRIERALTHLRETFGTMRALSITTERITEYELARIDAGAARATVNYELSILRRAFRLAVRARKLTIAPSIVIRDPKNVRTGFFEPDDFEAVLAELPDYLQSVMRFAYLTGWRVASEVLPLEWSHVDLAAGVLHLDPGTTKNGEGRAFPFSSLPALKTLIDEQRAAATAWQTSTDSVVRHVFHRNGQPIKSYKNAWERACDRAAHGGKRSDESPRQLTRPRLVDAIVHDFRRTAVRNLEAAGVPRSVATKITGHKTESIYKRYAISNDADMRAGLAKLDAYMNPAPSAPSTAKGSGRGPRRFGAGT